jgi:hypothetical protein
VKQLARLKSAEGEAEGWKAGWKAVGLESEGVGGGG